MNGVFRRVDFEKLVRNVWKGALRKNESHE